MNSIYSVPSDSVLSELSIACEAMDSITFGLALSSAIFMKPLLVMLSLAMLLPYQFFLS